MKYLLCIIQFTFIINLFSQSNKTDSLVLMNDMPTASLIYGNALFQDRFENTINSFKSYDYSNPVRTIGLSLNIRYSVNWKYEQTGHISYTQLLPQNLIINDTLTARILGYTLSVNIASVDLNPSSKHLSLPLGWGFNTGRLKLKSDSYKSQKNPFFAPTLFFNPRVFINRVVIGLRADYQFDISKKGWRSVIVTKGERSFHVDRFSQTGLILNASLGWLLFEP